jgi:acyl-CoA synthetase (AMP-forming)/AMP-acid ligase II
MTPTLTLAKKSLGSIASLIFTSGTSGNPKAVSIKSFQYIIVSTPIPLDADQPRPPLRIYSCLPLFHGTCLFTGLLYATSSSGTFCLARKFSASRFSEALVHSRADRFLYVGELCRYLIAAPPSPHDRAHACTIAWGNGLQRDVWSKLMARFAISEVREFYRSTEGVAKFDNFASGPAGVGMCGFAGGPVARTANDVTYIVRYDPDTEAPWRDPRTGFCVRARTGEPGEAIGRVKNPALYHDYLGDEAANAKKLLRDVFAVGDLFQRSGDLVLRGEDGWVRFVERAGDSYRWKGENVSAGEVKEHIAHLSGVGSVEVFGVILDG